VSLLSIDDPVYVVDLTPEALQECRAELDQPLDESSEGGIERELGPAPSRPIRAVALVLDRNADPLLVPVRPTRDVRMLDALARLLRVGMTTGTSVATLATEHGDAYIQRLYFRRELPGFVYEGLPRPARERAPRELTRIFGARRP
jgi:hypothetical protein